MSPSLSNVFQRIFCILPKVVLNIRNPSHNKIALDNEWHCPLMPSNSWRSLRFDYQNIQTEIPNATEIKFKVIGGKVKRASFGLVKLAQNIAQTQRFSAEPKPIKRRLIPSQD